MRRLYRKYRRNLFTNSSNNNPFFTKEKEDKSFSPQNSEGEQTFFQSASNKNQTLQTKLALGRSNNSYEKEADTVADGVTNALSSSDQSLKISNSISSVAQRSSSSDNAELDNGVEEEINRSKGGGGTLPNGIKEFMESRFGADFSNVKIHTGAKASQLNEQLNAKAFTVGDDIFFNSGAFDPNTKEGQHLLAHELTHVVQQSDQQQQVQREEKEILHSYKESGKLLFYDKRLTFKYRNDRIKITWQLAPSSKIDDVLLHKGFVDGKVVYLSNPGDPTRVKVYSIGNGESYIASLNVESEDLSLDEQIFKNPEKKEILPAEPQSQPQSQPPKKDASTKELLEKGITINNILFGIRGLKDIDFSYRGEKWWLLDQTFDKELSNLYDSLDKHVVDYFKKNHEILSEVEERLKKVQKGEKIFYNPKKIEELGKHKKKIDEMFKRVEVLKETLGVQPRTKILKGLKFASKLGKLLGPVGTFIGVSNLVSSKTKEEFIQNSVDLAVDVSAYFYPILTYGSLTYSITRFADGVLASMSKEYLGEDYSLSTKYSEYMLAMDKTYNKYLFGKQGVPEYETSIFYRIAYTFNL